MTQTEQIYVRASKIKQVVLYLHDYILAEVFMRPCIKSCWHFDYKTVFIGLFFFKLAGKNVSLLQSYYSQIVFSDFV